MKTKNQATSQSEAVKNATKKICRRNGNRKMKYTIAAFLATGGMPWLM